MSKKNKKLNQMFLNFRQEAEKREISEFQNGGYKQNADDITRQAKSISQGISAGKNMTREIEQYTYQLNHFQNLIQKSGFDESWKSDANQFATTHHDSISTLTEANSARIQQRQLQEQRDKIKPQNATPTKYEHKFAPNNATHYGHEPSPVVQAKKEKAEIQKQINDNYAKYAPFLDREKLKKSLHDGSLSGKDLKYAKEDYQAADEYKKAELAAKALEKNKGIAKYIEQGGTANADSQAAKASTIVSVLLGNQAAAPLDFNKMLESAGSRDEKKRKISSLLTKRGYKTTEGITADDIAEYLVDKETRNINFDRAQQTAAEVQKVSTDHPVLSTGLALATAPLKTLGTGETIAKTVEGWLKDEKVYMDANDPIYSFNNLYSNVVSTTAENLKNNYGDFASEAYQFGVTLADNGIRAAATMLLGGGKVAEAVSLVSMGLGVMNDTAVELTNLGMDAKSAGTLSFIAGGAEVVTEMVPLDNLLGMLKNKSVLNKQQIIRGLVSQIITEGAEEGMSDVINDVADVVYEMVSVNPSRRQLEIEQLIKKEGLSYEEAYRQWTHDHTLDYIRDIAGGMLSGGIMAGSAMGTNAMINNTAAGANIMQYGSGNKSAVKAEIQGIIASAAKKGQTINKKQANVIRLNQQMNNGGLSTGNKVYDDLVNNGLNSTDASVRKQAQKLAVMRDQNGRQSLTGIGKLQNLSLRANTNVAVGTATQMLESVGTPVNVIEAVTGAIKGEELSKKEIKRIQSSPDAMSVMMQLYETATGEAVNLDEHSSADEIREVAGRLYGTTFETDNTQAGKLYSMAAAMRANGDIGFNGVKGFMSGYRENLNMSLEEYANMFKLAYNESKAGKSPEAIAEHIHSIFAANEADEATTAARDTAVLRAALTAQNDIEHENKQAKKEKKEAKQEAEEDVTDNLHSKSGLEEDISEEDSVTKEAVESAKKLSRLSESEKADKYKNGGAIVESTKKLTTQQSAIISFYDYRGKKHGITYRFVDVIESNKGARGEYNHQTEVITIRIGTVADMTATAGHELGHWLKAHYPEEYEQMQQYLKDTVFKTNYEAKVAAKIAAYKKADITIDKEAGFEELTNDCLFGVDMASSEYEEFVRANETLMQKAFRVIRELLEDLQHFMEDWRKQLPEMYKQVTEIKMVQELYDDVEFMEYTADWVDRILNKSTASEQSAASEQTTDAGEQKNSTTAESGVSYELADNAEADIDKVLNDIHIREEVTLTKNTPSIITSQKGSKNLPMMMNASHVRTNILTKEEARKKGIKIKANDNYHGLGKTRFLKIIAGLDDVTRAYRGTKNAQKPERRENLFILVSQFTDEDGNTVIVPVYINEKGQSNRVVIDTNKLASVYGKGGFENYIQNEIKNGNLVRIKNRSNQVGERTAPIAGSYGSNTSNNSISDSSKKSNSSFQVSDSDYLEAARNGDEAKAAEYVEQAAKEWGAFSDGKPEPINLYHGTKSFGFTEFDLKKMDDGQSIYMTSDIETAQSYSGTTRKTRISNADKIVDYSVLSKEELADSLNEYIDTLNVGKGYDEIINTEYEYWNKEDIDYFLSHHNEFDSAYNNLQHVFEKSKESLEDGAIIETNGIENEKIISKQEANEILKNARITNRGNYSLYAKFENPLIVDCRGAEWHEIPFETERKVKRNRFVVSQYLLGEYTIDDWKNEFGFYTDSEENDFKPAGITEFDKELMVFSTEETAKKYLSDFLKKKHLKNYEIEYTESNRLSNTRQVADFAQQAGYDGVIFKNIYDNGGRGIGEVYTADYIAVAFDSSQVKSADPITYDGNGEIIPLSERFSESKDIRYSVPDKQEQFDIIQKANPAEDDYHTWIRSVDDIRTYDEIMSEIADADEFGGTDDYTYSDAKTALQENRVVVYSSKPIANGIFVTPSETEAKSFAGNSAIYSKPVALSDVAWIDEIQGQYAKANQSERKYSYEYFINKSPMKITTVDDSKQYPSSKIARNSAVNNAMKGAAQIGRKNEKGNVFVAVDDIQTDVMISKKSLRHSLDRRLSINAPVVEKIGTILKNAIRVNELNPRTEEIEKSYALIGIAKNSKNEPYVVSFVVNGYSNELMSMDILYSVNAKKEATGLIDPELSPQSGGSLTASTISISDLLELVNEYFPDHLPEDVLKHFDHEARPEGVIGESALYQISDTTLTPEQQAAIERKATRREMAKLERENENLKAALDAALKQTKLSKDFRHDESKTAQIAKKLLRKFGVRDVEEGDYRFNRFVDALNKFYDTIDDSKLEGTGGSDVTYMAALEAIESVRDSLEETDYTNADYLREFLSDIGTTDGRSRIRYIYLNEDAARSVLENYGSFKNVISHTGDIHFKALQPGESHATLDEMWEAEIAGKWGDVVTGASEMSSDGLIDLTDSTMQAQVLINAIENARDVVQGRNTYNPLGDKSAFEAAGEIVDGEATSDESYIINEMIMDLYESYNDAEWQATFADKKANKERVKYLQYKSKLRQSMDRYRAQVNERNETYRKKIEKNYQERYNKAISRNDLRVQMEKERLADYKAKVAESRKKATERKRQTELKNKIRKIALELARLGGNPNKQKHMPSGLLKVTKEFLQAFEINMTGAAQQKRFRDYIDSIKDEFKNMETNPDYKDAVENWQNRIKDQLEDLELRVRSKNINELDSNQLQDVYLLAREIKRGCIELNGEFINVKNATPEEFQENIRVERKGKKKEKVRAVLKPLENFIANDKTPYYFFEGLQSPTMMKMYRMLTDGLKTWHKDSMEAEAKLNEIKEKYHYSDWNQREKFHFKLESGEEIDLNLQMIMSMKAYSEREAGITHILGGGAKFANGTEARRFLTDKLREKYDDHRYNISEKDFYRIYLKLTPEQIGFVHEMRDYLTSLGEKGNEVSRAMWDIELFNEKKYFPIRTVDEYNRMSEHKVVDAKKMKYWGSSKPLIPNADNPIMVEEFMDVVERHIHEMSLYHSLTIPLENFQKVYGHYRIVNFVKAHKVNLGNGIHAIESVDFEVETGSIRDCFTKAEQDYISNFLQDVNGGVLYENNTGWDKAIAKTKKMTTALNLRVTAQQPGALARAFAYVAPKYFGTAMHKGAFGIKADSKTVKEMETYSVNAFIKKIGGFDTGTGMSTRQWLDNKEYKGKQKVRAFFDDGQYRDQKLLFAPEMMDRITWVQIWEACKNKIAVEEKLTGEELRVRAGKLFDEVTEKTQVYDSVFSRSGYMRSKNALAKMFTAYMAEPTKTINMLWSAFVNHHGDAKFVAGVTASVITSIILTNLLASVIDAMRHGKDDDNGWELWTGELTSDIISDLIPFNYLPIVRDIYSIFSGYDVKRTDLSLVSDFVKATKKIIKANQDGTCTYDDWFTFISAACAMVGLPTKSVWKDIKGIWTMAKILGNDTTPTVEGFKKAFKKSFYDELAIDDFLGIEQPSENKYDTIYLLYAAGKYDKADARMEALIKKELESTKPEYGESDAEKEKRIREKIESGWETYIKQQMFDKNEFERIYQFMLNGDTKKAVEMKKSLLKEAVENVVLMKDEKKEQGQARVKEYFEKTYQSFMQEKLKDKKEIVSAAKVLSAGNLNQAKTAIANLTKQGFTEEDVLKSIYHNINAQIPEGEDFSRDGAIFRVSYSRSLEANALVNTKSMKAAALADIDHDIKTRVRIQNSLRNSGYKQDDIRRATDYLKSQLKNDSEEDDEDEEKSIFKASDLGWATLKADTATIRVCAKGYTEFYLKTHKAKTKEDEEEIKKAARKNIRTQISKIVKDEYYKASSTRRKQIHQLMLSSGAYDNGDAVSDVCNGWVKDIAKKKFGN